MYGKCIPHDFCLFFLQRTWRARWVFTPLFGFFLDVSSSERNVVIQEEQNFVYIVFAAPGDDDDDDDDEQSDIDGIVDGDRSEDELLSLYFTERRFVFLSTIMHDRRRLLLQFFVCVPGRQHRFPTSIS